MGSRTLRTEMNQEIRADVETLAGTSSDMKREGWEGWDEYAPFYDWENARTLGRRDVPFWRRVALGADGRGARARMRNRTRLAAARARGRRARRHRSVGADARRARAARSARVTEPVQLTRRLCVSSAATSARCRSRPRAFAMVIAPYGILQSLLRPTRSGRDARLGRACPRAGRHLRHRSRARRAQLARVRQPRPAARARPAAAPAHADRIGPAGSAPPADDVRAALRGTARRPHHASTASS